MGCDGLCLSSLLDHEELRQDGHRLKVDGEGPEDLHHGELVVEQQRQDDGGQEQELDPENGQSPYLRSDPIEN